VITRRVLAVVAAVLLVGAVALAMLGPPDMPLSQALLAIDQRTLGGLQSGIERIFTHWTWTQIALPVLMRPAWLIPAALGLIFAGLSLTFPGGGRPQGSRQRRF
jgi:hypothetical protein